jgi:5,10-methylenetetrahydromethanopterin reductase
VSGEREFGLGLQTNKRPGDYAVLARIAEDGGFAVITSFNDLWFQPALPALLEIAAATRRVRVGPSCLNPYTTHPVELAGQIAALDAASEGRAFLGLAAGAWLEELGLEQSAPAQTVREAWAVVSRLLAGDRSGFEGQVFRLAPGKGLAYESLRPRVPLLVGTWSPQLTAFAAEEADELKLGGTANPALVRLACERLEPSGRAVAVVAGAVTVVDEDGSRARLHARREVTRYLPVVADLDPTLELDSELLGRMKRAVANGETDAAAALVSDDLLDLFAFSGTPRQIAAQAEALFDAGAHRVEFGTPHGLDDRTGAALLACEVVARLHGDR